MEYAPNEKILNSPLEVHITKYRNIMKRIIDWVNCKAY